MASSSAITRMARILGAPVTEPGGKDARRSSASPTPGRSVPVTVETRCQTPGASRSSVRAGTSTLPYSQTLPRSLRIRSTIITFSARSFADRESASPAPLSRGAVPLIGSVSTCRPRRRRKSSGEALHSAPHGPATSAAWRGASARVVRANRSSGSPDQRPSRRRQMLAWKISPSAIRSRQAATASGCPAVSCGEGASVPTHTCPCVTPRSRRSRSSPRRRRSAESRASLQSASNHHCPSQSRRRRWS